MYSASIGYDYHPEDKTLSILANMGEEEQYYIRDHHEPIVSREIWDEAEKIRLRRVNN